MTGWLSITEASVKDEPIAASSQHVLMYLHHGSHGSTRGWGRKTGNTHSESLRPTRSTMESSEDMVGLVVRLAVSTSVKVGVRYACGDSYPSSII